MHQVRRAPGIVDHVKHRPGYFFGGGFGEWKALFGNIFRVEHKMRLLEDAAQGDATDGVGHLQGRGSHRALTDGH